MGIKKGEVKQLQNIASNMIKILTLMTNETGRMSEIATKLTDRAETSQKKSSIKMAQNMNNVMIELSTSLSIIGAALQKAIQIK